MTTLQCSFSSQTAFISYAFLAIAIAIDQNHQIITIAEKAILAENTVGFEMKLF